MIVKLKIVFGSILNIHLEFVNEWAENTTVATFTWTVWNYRKCVWKEFKWKYKSYCSKANITVLKIILLNAR